MCTDRRGKCFVHRTVISRISISQRTDKGIKLDLKLVKLKRDFHKDISFHTRAFSSPVKFMSIFTWQAANQAIFTYFYNLTFSKHSKIFKNNWGVKLRKIDIFRVIFQL